MKLLSLIISTTTFIFVLGSALTQNTAQAQTSPPAKTAQAPADSTTPKSTIIRNPKAEAKAALTNEFLMLTDARTKVNDVMNYTIRNIREASKKHLPLASKNDPTFWNGLLEDSRAFDKVKRDSYVVMFNMYYNEFDEQNLKDLIQFVKSNPAGKKLVNALSSETSKRGFFESIVKITDLHAEYARDKLMSPEEKAKAKAAAAKAASPGATATPPGTAPGAEPKK